MKNVKSKVALFSGALLVSATTIAQTNYWQPTGNIGIGSGSSQPNTLLTVFNQNPLGTNLVLDPDGELISSPNVRITSFGGGTGLNGFYNNLWLRRKANGNDWATTVLHDGVSVDGSFQTPGLDTRVWWERDPYSNKQAWGDQNTTYMQLVNGNLGLGMEPGNLGKLVVAGSQHWKFGSSSLTVNNTNPMGIGGITFSVSSSSNLLPITLEASKFAFYGGNYKGKFLIEQNGKITSESEVNQPALMQLHSSSGDKGAMYKVTNWNSAGFGFGFDVVAGGGIEGGIFDQLNDSTPTKIIGFNRTIHGPQVWIGSKKGAGQHIDARLSVDGKLLATSIFVSIASNDWADYVFEKDYQLMKLQDVENYYTSNKHLPGVPSAQEISETGIDVAHTDAMLMKKIEELTIYLVEQNKRLDNLEKENKELVQKLNQH